GVAGQLSDETGTGALVFGTAPTITTSAQLNGYLNLGTGTAGSTYTLNIAPTSGATAGSTVFIQDATASTGKTTAVIKAGAGNSGNDNLMAIQNNIAGAIYSFRYSGLLVNNGIQTDSSHAGSFSGTGSAETTLAFGVNGKINWSTGTASFQGSVD